MKRTQEIAEANLNRPKTVRDVRLFITKRSGEILQTLPYNKTKHRFALLADKLGEQIAKDTKLSYETNGSLPPDETLLSPEAAEMLVALKAIKSKM